MGITFFTSGKKAAQQGLHQISGLVVASHSVPNGPGRLPGALGRASDGHKHDRADRGGYARSCSDLGDSMIE